MNFGPGKVASLANELDRRGLKRALVVTGKTLGGSALLDKVTSALGPRCCWGPSIRFSAGPKCFTLPGTVKAQILRFPQSSRFSVSGSHSPPKYFCKASLKT